MFLILSILEHHEGGILQPISPSTYSMKKVVGEFG
jgi:hypothetical protein